MKNRQLMTEPLKWLTLHLIVRCTLLVNCCFLAGCGSGERVYRLTGTITYKGKPVPSGMIIFEPDSSKGNSGAPGRSKIEEGRYDTASEEGHGVVGGPHLIRIIGMDGRTQGQSAAEIGLPNMLFPEFNLKEDLPLKDGVKDFEVPEKR